jgi:hypothetical protein
MMKKGFSLFILISILSFSGMPVSACTTCIIASKATKDGRPLLLKNRDSDELQNKLMYFNDGTYPYIGLVNSNDSTGKEVWGGFNSTGFSIINSASYNIKKNDTTKLSDKEGVLMKAALKICATVADFEKLLGELPKPLGVEANFGVIDANGGAAYFETGNFSYVKYDVNDPAVAPDGYLIRTNYSCSGIEDKGAGYIRYTTARELFKDRNNKEKFEYSFLLNDVCRCLKHSLTKTDLSKDLPEDSSDTRYVWFQDYIPRPISSSAIIFQGVKNGEDPMLTTMWSVIGFPLTSVVVPVWITKNGSMPQVLVASQNGKAPLCEMSLKLKSRVLSDFQQRGDKYMDISKLMNKSGTGIRQKLSKIEKEIIKKGESNIMKWRNSKINDAGIESYYGWVDKYILESFKGLLE